MVATILNFGNNLLKPTESWQIFNLKNYQKPFLLYTQITNHFRLPKIFKYKQSAFPSLNNSPKSPPSPDYPLSSIHPSPPFSHFITSIISLFLPGHLISQNARHHFTNCVRESGNEGDDGEEEVEGGRG